MTDAAAARRWVEGYVGAWRSNDRSDVRALFTDDATYRASPDGAPVAGREAIVDWWLENADAPDETTFSFDVIGTDGPRVFVQGVTVYRAKDDRPARTYDNLWVIDITEDGRANAFTEWYMRRRD